MTHVGDGGRKLRMELGAATSAGRVRATNQDAVLATEGATPGSYLLAVADGVGGLLDGAEASSSVVDALAARARGSSPDLAGSLCDVLIEANSQVYARGSARGFPSATTIVLLVAENTAFAVIHAGDSRAYLWRDGTLRRLTEDHSWIAEQERAGTMTADEAAASPYRNIITRCIGAEPTVTLERRPAERWMAGDVFLLSSDGLHGLIDEAPIGETLAAGGSAQEIAERLVLMANNAGGTDNISAVVARVE